MSTVAIQGPVEARSLSSITAIASNPPAYPRNPTHEKHDPLVLYIVRVPGSQDIFLSPLKPPTKSSVSAEAINASLYYLHIATPDDDALLQEVEQEREEEAQRRREALEAAGPDDPAQREFLRLNNVRRKPVGRKDSEPENEAPMPQDDAPQAPTEVPEIPPPLPRRPAAMPQFSTENMSFAGTPVANAQQHLGVQPVPRLPSPTTPNTFQRRPLPPVPPTEEPWNEHPSSGDEPRKTNRWSAFTGNRGLEAWKERYEALSAGRHSLDSHRPPLPPRPTSQGRPGSANRSPGGSPNRQRKAVPGPANNSGFTITLIRRDPSSGTQWNVATITAPPTDRNAIDIEIATPGYNRFTGSNEPLSLANLAANLPPGLVRTAETAMPQPRPVEQPIEKPSGPRKFHRQVCVSKPFDDSTGTRNPSDLKSGYYVFNSPWNGTCTFSSSVNGRSLKCKHMISGPCHAPTSEGENPNPAVTVAEIRFNTPFQAANLHYHTSNRAHGQSSNHNLPPSPDSPTHPNLASSKRNSFSNLLNPNTYSRPRAHSGPNTPATIPENTRQPMSPAHILRRTSLRAQSFARQSQFPHHRRSTSNSSGGADSDEDRLDLSLARELAGGGMRGKSAKLGKLIIEDEGIKMLDLVVAACMAVWWRGYYH